MAQRETIQSKPQQQISSDSVKPKVSRQTRKPFGSTDQKLAVPAIPGYHQHWFNDDPGRIFQAKEAGYEHVTDERNAPISRNVGVATGGGPLLAYLMRIPQEWWEEDMSRQQKIVDQRMDAIRRGQVDKKDPKDRDVFYAGSDRGQIDIRDGSGPYRETR